MVPIRVWLAFATLLAIGHLGHSKVLDLSVACDLSDNSCELNNLTSSIEDPLEVLDSKNTSIEFTHLVVKSSSIALVPRNLLQYVPNLETFEMHKCQLKTLRPGDFVNVTQKLKSLNFERNRLSELSENVFANLADLEEIRLGHNHILHVHQKAFRNGGNGAAAKLKVLKLNSNTIHELAADVFQNLTHLEYIDLSDNRIEKINSNLFRNNLNLKTVRLNDNRFVLFQSNSFEHLSHLSLLDLSSNVVGDIRLQSVATLRIANANLRTCTINGSVVTLHASHNELQTIWVGDKRSCIEIDLRNNSIASVDAFSDMVNLEKFDVSLNPLKKSNGLRTLSNLKRLNLSATNVHDLGAETFRRLDKLTLLDVSYNKLTTFDVETFASLKNLETLYLGGNRLHTLDYEALTGAHKHLKEIGLFANDWDVAHLKNMLHHFKRHKVKVVSRVDATDSGDSANPDNASAQDHNKDYESRDVPWGYLGFVGLSLIVVFCVISYCLVIILKVDRHRLLTRLRWNKSFHHIDDTESEAL